jgi:hypothetical protein
MGSHLDPNVDQILNYRVEFGKALKMRLALPAIQKVEAYSFRIVPFGCVG